MTRYTSKQLENDVERFNARLESAGSDNRFEWGHRNGCNAIDVFTVPRKSGCVDRNLQCGTPRECSQLMETEFYRLLLEVTA